jgi:4-aminobutyrate aminotransferase / (S)-3-amino-2-methylpropionate transaminase / 5-aminovalerate transaminase
MGLSFDRPAGAPADGVANIDSGSELLPQISTEIPGPKSREIFASEQRYIAPGRQRISLLAGIALDHGKGATLTDVDGNVYVDFVAGIGVASLGHAHPALASALAQQAQRLMVGTFATAERAKAFRLLTDIAPSNLKRAHLYSGGAEAVEAALRLARSATRKNEVVSFWGGFHGKTGGVMGLIGDESKHGYGPLPGGQYVVPYADCYRCPFKLKYPSCGLHCVEFARQQVRNASSGSVAAVLVEPMQGTAGNVIPPDDWLPAVKSMAQDLGGLLIADEMITGFGRTGRMWGIEHSATQPDIITAGKGIGAGFPVSAVLMGEQISHAAPFSKPSASSSSYGGNPMAAVAVAETIKTIQRDQLAENSRKVGATLLGRMLQLKEKYEFVGDVRGRGLLIGLDLVRDLVSRRELSRQVMEIVFRESLRRGLLLMGYFPRIRINPPLVISERQAEVGADIMDEVFAYVRDHVDWRAGD